MKRVDRLLSSAGRAPGSSPALELRIPAGSREAHHATWNRDVPRVVATLVLARSILDEPFTTRFLLDLLKRLSLKAVVPMTKRASLVDLGYVVALGMTDEIGRWDVTNLARADTERLGANPLLDEAVLRGLLKRPR